jgi:hypothetical protein
MLKFLHEARISDFTHSWHIFSPDFKYIILFCLDKLLGLPYIVENLEMFSFHHNLNGNKISHVAPDMF